MNLEFCNKLKQLRKKHNVSQIDISEYLNVSRATYSNYENGITEPSINSIISIAKFYNVSLDFLLTGTESEIKKTLHFDDFQLTIPEFDRNKILKSMYSKKNKYLKLLEYNNTIINNYISEIDKIIILLEEENTTNKISPSNTIEFNPNSIDVDFYNKNNVKIFNSYNSKNNMNTYSVPKVGSIAAGEPIFAQAEHEEFFYIPNEDLKGDKNNYFVLQIEGESMNKLYKDKSYILCYKQNFVIPNTPLVVLIDDYATVKYVEEDFKKNTFTLIPCSTLEEYKPSTYSKYDYSLNIFGKVLGVVNKQED